MSLAATLDIKWLISDANCLHWDAPLKKLAANPALLTVPSDTNFIHSVCEVERTSSGLS